MYLFVYVCLEGCIHAAYSAKTPSLRLSAEAVAIFELFPFIIVINTINYYSLATTSHYS